MAIQFHFMLSLAFAYLILPINAHMQLIWPYALRSKFNPATPSNQIDYSMKAPLTSDPLNFPCKGYENNTPLDVVTMYEAGSTYNMTLDGTADHGGGSCQLSLSYDNGQTFKVIKSIIGGCTKQWTYDFTVPAYAPTGKALFAWSWSNFMGNREFYMNCAVVHVMSSTVSSQQFDDLPNIWVADLAGVNSCTTDADNGSMDPVYPEPGPDVEYGDGLSSDSPVTPGLCEVPVRQQRVVDPPAFTYDPESSSTASQLPSTSFVAGFMTATSATVSLSVGRTLTSTLASSSTSPVVQPLSSTSSSTFSTMIMSAPISAATTSSSSTSLMVNQTGSTSATSTPITAAMIMASTFFPGLSTTTMTVDCPSTITITLPSITSAATFTMSTTASTCTGTAAVCPCANGYACLAVGSCTWECLSLTTSPSFQTSISRVSTVATSTSTGLVVSSTSTILAQLAPTVTTQAQASTVNSTPLQPASIYTLGYVDAQRLRAYLPCMPGSFICTDPSTWYTCAVEADGSYDYQYPRVVAAGMQCVPHLTPSTGWLQGSTPPSYYRDDQYARASNTGSCSIDGTLQCINSGRAFQICDHGAWVDMGSVAAGTKCQNGQIVAA